MASYSIVARPKGNVLVTFVFLLHKVVDLLIVPSGIPDQMLTVIKNSCFRMLCLLNIVTGREKSKQLFWAPAVLANNVWPGGKKLDRLEVLDGIFAQVTFIIAPRRDVYCLLSVGDTGVKGYHKAEDRKRGGHGGDKARDIVRTCRLAEPHRRVDDARASNSL